MRPDIDVVSFFGQVAAALDLTAEQKERAWSMMTKAGVGMSDPTSVYFAILAKMDGLTSGLSADFEKSGETLVDEMRKSMSAEMQKQLSALPSALTQKLDARMADAIKKLADGAANSIEEEASRRQTFRLGGLALGAALLAVATCGLGYYLGRDAINAEAAKWSALVELKDGGKWLSLARMNDLDKTLGQNCGPGDGRVISGGKVCDLALYVSQPVATSTGVNLVSLSLAEYANKLGWLGYGAVAVAAFVVGRMSKRRYG